MTGTGRQHRSAGFATALTVSIVLGSLALPATALASVADPSPDQRCASAQAHCQEQRRDHHRSTTGPADHQRLAGPLPGGELNCPVPAAGEKPASKPAAQTESAAKPAPKAEEPPSTAGSAAPKPLPDRSVQPVERSNDEGGAPDPKDTPAPNDHVRPAPKDDGVVPAKTELGVADTTTTTVAAAARDEPAAEPATTATVADEEPIIGLIPPISVVRPQPGLREASGPVTVAPAAPAPTMVRVLGVQVTRQTLPATGVDTDALAIVALVMLVAGSGFLAWGGRRASDRL